MLVSLKGINSTTAKKLATENLGPKARSFLGLNPEESELEVIDRSKNRAIRGIIAPKGYSQEKEILFFQFNPSQISDSKGMDWFSSKYLGFSAPELFWTGGQDRVITFDLFFDATTDSIASSMGSNTNGYDAIRSRDSIYPRGVMDMVEKLQAFQYPINTESPRFVGNVATPSPKFEAPPILIFCFGLFYMECALTGLQTSYELFDTKLVARRATCSVSLTVYEFSRVNINTNLPQVTSENEIR
jgi:hypothetical protein